MKKNEYYFYSGFGAGRSKSRLYLIISFNGALQTYSDPKPEEA